MQAGLSGLVSRGLGKFEHGNGISLSVVCPPTELVKPALPLPFIAASVEARILAVEPRFDAGVRCLDVNSAGVDALLDTVEVALKRTLRPLGQGDRIPLERLQPAVDAVQPFP